MPKEAKTYKIRLSHEQAEHLADFYYDPETDDIGVGIRTLIRISILGGTPFTEGVDREARLRANRVGAERPPQEKDFVLSSGFVPSSDFQAREVGGEFRKGDARGKPREGEGRKGKQQTAVEPVEKQPEELTVKKQQDPPRAEMPDELKPYKEQIETFWAVKKGSKSNRSYNLLISELAKIKNITNEQDFLDQLEIGTANRWQGMTLKNFQAYGQDNSQKPKPWEQPHSTNSGAGKIFKAEEQPKINYCPPPAGLAASLKSLDLGVETLAT